MTSPEILEPARWAGGAAAYAAAAESSWAAARSASLASRTRSSWGSFRISGQKSLAVSGSLSCSRLAHAPSDIEVDAPQNSELRIAFDGLQLTDCTTQLFPCSQHVRASAAGDQGTRQDG